VQTTSAYEKSQTIYKEHIPIISFLIDEYLNRLEDKKSKHDASVIISAKSEQKKAFSGEMSAL
jgi:hypothetical protein